MRNVYIVVERVGKWDDVLESNLSAYLTLERAQQDVVKLKAQYERLKAIQREIYQAGHRTERALVSMKSERPAGPARPNKETLDIWHSEMAAWNNEAMAVTAHNNRIHEINNAAKLEAARAKAVELGCDEADLKVLGIDQEAQFMGNTDLNAEFSIEEIPFYTEE